MNLSNRQKECHRIAVMKGWYNPGPELSETILNIQSELSEAWEEIRSGHAPEEIYLGPDGKPEGFPVEIADAAIRMLDMCEHLGIDLDSVIERKLNYNIGRPHRHGGKKC